MNNFPTMPQAAAGLPVPCTRLLATSIPLHLPKLLPRLNGDTRRRKRRLREKLEKKDAINYGPAIRAWVEDQKRRICNEFIDNLRMTAIPTFANSVIDAPTPDGTKPIADIIEAAHDLATAARRVRAKCGTDKQGKPRDWTEWKDLDDACDAVDRVTANLEANE